MVREGQFLSNKLSVYSASDNVREDFAMGHTQVQTCLHSNTDMSTLFSLNALGMGGFKRKTRVFSFLYHFILFSIKII